MVGVTLALFVGPEMIPFTMMVKLMNHWYTLYIKYCF